jgi:hypothetical protein
MTELSILKRRKRDLTWSMLLNTPSAFFREGTLEESIELDRVTARINALTGRA